ncbi:MAG: DUF998 domain-containing protein [Sulfitobacter sp.]
MSNSTFPDHPPRAGSAHMLHLLSVLSLIGGVVLILGNIVGSIVVPNHDWVADTVSDLAAGRFEIIQDVALYGYAGALLALALATAHVHAETWRWTALMLLLVVIAVFVVIIGARNEYGDGDNEGIVIHIYIVYAMGLAFVASFVLAALVYAQSDPWFARVSWIAAALWTVGAPIFFFMPTGYDGAWERGLGVISVVWSTAYARVIWRMAQR